MGGRYLLARGIRRTGLLEGTAAVCQLHRKRRTDAFSSHLDTMEMRKNEEAMETCRMGPRGLRYIKWTHFDVLSYPIVRNAALPTMAEQRRTSRPARCGQATALC